MDCNSVTFVRDIVLGLLELLNEGLKGLDIHLVVAIAEFKLLCVKATNAGLEILLNRSKELIIGIETYLLFFNTLIGVLTLAERGLEHCVACGL